jgi:hypothetical protein
MAFEIDLRNFQTYERWLKRAPKQIKGASVMLLNNYAFGTRTESINIIAERMFIKKPGFVPSRIQVEKASVARPMSRVGSVALPRFSGWEEQETGKRTERTRVFTLLARGGKAREARREARLKPGGDRPVPEDYEGVNAHHRVIVMLGTLNKQGYRRAFIIRGHKRMKPGLYKFKGGKKKRQLHMLQAFKPRKVQPKRIRWLTGGRDRYMRSHPPGKVWAKVMKRVLKFKGR